MIIRTTKIRGYRHAQTRSLNHPLFNVGFTGSLAEDKPAYPVVDGKYVVVERMLVKAGYEQWFEDYWRNTVLPVFAEIDGFEGGYMLANTALPTDPAGETDFGEILPMGPPSKVFLGHGGIHLNGVQTDTQINFDAMLVEPITIRWFISGAIPRH